jgi:hypothetical protein
VSGVRRSAVGHWPHLITRGVIPPRGVRVSTDRDPTEPRQHCHLSNSVTRRARTGRRKRRGMGLRKLPGCMDRRSCRSATGGPARWPAVLVGRGCLAAGGWKRVRGRREERTSSDPPPPLTPPCHVVDLRTPPLSRRTAKFHNHVSVTMATSGARLTAPAQPPRVVWARPIPPGRPSARCPAPVAHPQRSASRPGR